MYKYLVLLAFLLMSCSNNKEVTISHENGKAKQIYSVNDENQKQGQFQEFTEEGVLMEQSNYKADVLDGKRSIFFPDGTIEIEEIYQAGKLEGVHKVFYPSGKLMIESKYTNGKMNGLFSKYFESGDLMETITFKDNMEVGPFKEYHANGKVQWEGNYLNGDTEYGLLQQFDEKGELIKKMMCDSLGVCQTIWTPEKGDIVPEKLNLGNS